MKQCREEPYMQSQFLQRTNFIKTKSRYCISLNEHIVDMVYNIASNTQRILNVVWREDIIYECTRCEINYTFYMRPVEYAIKLLYSRFQTYIS